MSFQYLFSKNQLFLSCVWLSADYALLTCIPFRFTGETQPGLKECEDAAKKLIDLGLVFTPIEDALRETVDSLKAKGFLRHEMSQS